jgi:hypothetical protein
MLHNPIIDYLGAIPSWPDDPADDGNAFARAWHAVARAWHAVRPVLIPVGVGLGVFAAWVAVALLLYRLVF